MSQSSYYTGVLAFLIVITIFVIIIVIARIKEGKNAEPNEFDERQKLLRGESFKYGYITLIIYLVFYGVIEDLTGKHWGSAGICLGIIFSLGISVIFCIWKDAFFSRFSTGKLLTMYNISILLMMIVSLYWGIPAVLHSKKADPYDIVFFYIGIFDLIILAVIAVKRFKDRYKKDVKS